MGIVALFAIIGLGRAQLPVLPPRYVTTAAVFVLAAAGSLLPLHLPPSARRSALALALAFGFVAFGSNVLAMQAGAHTQLALDQTVNRCEPFPWCGDRSSRNQRTFDEELRSAVEPVVPTTVLRRSEEAAAAEAERLNAALAASEDAAERLRAELLASEQTLTGVLSSKSWRVTSPLRAVTNGLKRQGRWIR
jgi:hypothetical protein